MGNDTAIEQRVDGHLFAHKGEVVMVFSQLVMMLHYPPELARHVATQLINYAELAEQQMDSERG